MTNFMMHTSRVTLAASCIVCFATVSLAENPPGLITGKEVRSEISQAMAAVGNYAEQERDAALTQARAALMQLDATIEAREENLRDAWSDMSQEARDMARTEMKDLREARNMLGERYGALEAGSADSWAELKEGFGNAWDAFAEAWNSPDSTADAS